MCCFSLVPSVSMSQLHQCFCGCSGCRRRRSNMLHSCLWLGGRETPFKCVFTEARSLSELRPCSELVTTAQLAEWLGSSTSPEASGRFGFISKTLTWPHAYTSSLYGSLRKDWAFYFTKLCQISLGFPNAMKYEEESVVCLFFTTDYRLALVPRR